tara:strand:- start:1505 stop:2719 length:1215 start_codon:yes stop_codon:yes gene_type:complete
MAKKKKTEEVVDAPMGNQIKIKEQPKRMKKLGGEEETIKVNLNQEEKPVEETQVKEQPKEEAVEENKEEVVEEVKEETTEVETKKEEETEQPVLEEIVDETKEEKTTTEEKTVEEVKEEVVEAVEEAKQTGEPLPENIQKVIDFMNETGGDLEDYVKLNQDYSKYDDMTMLREYYRQTKPHLNADEVDFLIEDGFTFDEEVDDPKDIKRKKLAFKEQVASARSHMDELKSNYYEEIKSGVKLTPEQQKAVDFFNRYNKETEESQKIAEQQKSVFENKTQQVFNSEFKGFEYKVGDKRYRFNVNDVDSVKNTQSDINNFVSKFLDKNNTMNDAVGYHKSLFTAMNADAIANHFYQQGKADAVKETMAKAKNVDMTPRETGTVDTGGFKYKVLGDDSNSFKFKLKK